jgi:hypothetical protein
MPVSSGPFERKRLESLPAEMGFARFFAASGQRQIILCFSSSAFAALRLLSLNLIFMNVAMRQFDTTFIRRWSKPRERHLLSVGATGMRPRRPPACPFACLRMMSFWPVTLVSA